MAEVLLLDAQRTPFGKNRGGLSQVRVDDLAAHPLRELVARRPLLDPARIADVVYGDTNGAGEDNRNVARMAALLAGLPTSVPGVTVNRLCGSGAEAIVQAGRALAVGDAELIVAGGVEGMSRAPHVVAPIDTALPRRIELVPTAVGWRMPNPVFPPEWTASLGGSVDAIAAERGIDRVRQEAWAVRSHERADEAWGRGLHDDVVCPLAGVLRDESIRPGTTAEALASLEPAFTSGGTVTAGTSSPINDGAIAVLMGTPGAARQLAARPLCRVLSSAVAAVDPHRFALAPVPAVRAALRKANRDLSDVAVFEINEAFSAMVLACVDELEVPEEKVNPNGGALALGHPLGASAARIVVDCARELQRRGGGIGVAAACIGVGLGIALVVEV
ncbi:thiolase family protein [Actinocorallia libanotica]|uniref:Probable acetyl-CoA acetyltransferase n=1 Tax=Actinocorallia libanotica TaxID=46162 RepID=A0ABP4BU53_9ACTN